jgi:ribonuclease BN (tRNA processing enzyme)
MSRFVEFFDAADAVVFDAMYSLADAISVRADWGHSSNILGVELCQAARARRLFLFHHEPAFDDAKLADLLTQTRRFEALTREADFLEVATAYDGLEIAL